MKDTIYTIPINEVFEPKCGCPICSMRNTLETRCIDYITGAAMMEPDVRTDTNKLGFCKPHYEQMRAGRNRLSLALMLETHLAELRETEFPKKPPKGDVSPHTCYVCNKIDWALERQFTALCKLYTENEEFRQLFREQEVFCMDHYKALRQFAAAKMNKKVYPQFLSDLQQVVLHYLENLHKDVHHFTTMFDYRNAGDKGDWGNAKDAIERAIWFLTTR